MPHTDWRTWLLGNACWYELQTPFCQRSTVPASPTTHTSSWLMPQTARRVLPCGRGFSQQKERGQGGAWPPSSGPMPPPAPAPPPMGELPPPPPVPPAAPPPPPPIDPPSAP